MRRFEVQRDNDVTGVTGIGVIALGVQFPDGTCVLRWVAPPRQSTAIWEHIDDLFAVHCHDGKTRLHWLD